MKARIKFPEIKQLFFLTILFLLANGAGVCQNIQPQDVVSLKTVVNADSLKPAGILQVSITLNIKEGWHVNANKPLDDYLTPTAVTLTKNKNFKLRKIKYPPPLLMKLGFSENELALYENEVTVELWVKVKNPKSLTGEKLEGQVRYQPCNNQTCLFPVTKDFSINLKNKLEHH